MRWPWSRVAAAPPEPEDEGPDDEGPDEVYAYDLYLCCHGRVSQACTTYVDAVRPSEEVAAFALAVFHAKRNRPPMIRAHFLRDLRAMLAEEHVDEPPADGAAPPEAPATAQA